MSAPGSFLPLEGIRICDFTAVWAGQTASMYLADFGAECINVENQFVWKPRTRAAHNCSSGRAARHAASSTWTPTTRAPAPSWGS